MVLTNNIQIVNNNVYSVTERQLPKQENFKPGETKLTVLINPEKPKRAIVKENYLKL